MFGSFVFAGLCWVLLAICDRTVANIISGFQGIRNYRTYLQKEFNRLLQESILFLARKILLRSSSFLLDSMKNEKASLL
jgi:hypothetical protein